MFGFACDETPDFMPATLDYSTRSDGDGGRPPSGAAPFLEPDAKSQVTLGFEDGKPAKATAIVVSTQHKRATTAAKSAPSPCLCEAVVARVLPSELLGNETVYPVDPTSSCEIGGPDGDAGVPSIAGQFHTSDTPQEAMGKLGESLIRSHTSSMSRAGPILFHDGALAERRHGSGTVPFSGAGMVQSGDAVCHRNAALVRCPSPITDQNLGRRQSCAIAT